MPNQPSINPSAPNLTGTVLDNLQTASHLQARISETLNAALKTQLTTAATAANLPILVGLINALPPADLVASKDLSLQAFVQQQVDPKVGGDPVMKAAIDGEIAKLPLTATVSTTLNLTLPLASHPLLKGIVADAQLTTLLGTSPVINSAMQSRFVTLYNANQGVMPDFWTQLASDPELGAVVPQLQLTLQLGTLTSNNSDLVAKLQAQFHPTSTRDLTKLDSDQLAKLITAENIQVPPSIASTTTAATITQYADSIVSTLKEAFPTDYVAKSFTASTDTTNQAVAAFLAKSPDFDLATTNINTYLTTNATATAGLADDQVAALTDRLKSTQRVFRVIPDGDTIQSLINLELDSSYAIASTAHGSFIAQYADNLGGQDQAEQIYANATTISALNAHIIRQVQENAAQGTPWMIQSGNHDAEKVLNTNIPDWQTLFGSTSTCQCAECRAVDGPAAYFVSLLEFLRGLGKNSDKNTPLDFLIGTANSGNTHGKTIAGRRPDLANLKLNCANADTALPYVDLANEIMESYVASGQIGDSTAHDTPDDATPEELGVNPEYLQTPDAIKAYETLNSKSVFYPFALPYDCYLETVRNYLNFLGLSRYQLLQAFGLPLSASGPASPPLSQKTRLAAEALLISEPEYILITSQDFSGNKSGFQLAYYFGYGTSDPWQTDMSQVPTFLSRTGVAFGDLVDLLDTQYLNPQHLDPPNATTLLQTSTTDGCDITTMRIQNVDAFLAPLPPFIRLWQKLGWRIPELDYALRAFGVTPGVVTGDYPRPIPAGFILVVAQLKQLQEALNLSVAQTVALWKDIDTDGRDSHYISLFQNKAVINPPDPGFRLLYQVLLRTIPPALPANWSDGTIEDTAFYENANLQFIGSMTDSQRDQVLLKWKGTGDNNILAVQTLYSQRWYQGIKLAGTIPVASAVTRQALHPNPIPGPGPGPGPGVGGLPFPVPPGFYIVDSIGNNHINAILAALQIGASDLLAIVRDVGWFDRISGDYGQLTLSNLSLLYRYAILAQSLSLSIPDLITLKNLTGLQPFQPNPAAHNPQTEPLIQFVAAAQQVAASQFSVAQLAYLYGPGTGPASSLAPLQATQDQVMSTILVGLQNIAAANAFAPDPTGAALRKKLAVLLPSTQQLNDVMGLIGGYAVYTSALAALPSGLTLPPGSPISFVVTATIGGTITDQDSLSLTVTSSAVAGSPVMLSYTVQPGDTPNTIAAGLAALINHEPDLAGANITATVSGPVVSLSAPPALTPAPALTASWNPAGASETVALGGNLVCQGPISNVTATALGGLPGADTNFTNAVQDLYNQAPDVLTLNLGFLVPPGAYWAKLTALPAGVALPSDGPVYLFGPELLGSSGPMLNSTKTTFLALSKDAAFTAAVNSLYDQAWGPLSANLIDVPLTQANRYDYVLQGLLAYLTNAQSRNLVKHNLAQAIGLDSGVVNLLIDGNAALGVPRGLLPSNAVPQQPAMNDFLGGLSATYISTAPAVPKLQRIDPGINLVMPTGFTGVQWTGKLLVPTTGGYRFAVSVTGVGASPQLKIDGQAVNVATASGVSGAINLTAGQLCDISLEISAVPASAAIKLQWCIAPAPLSTLAPIPALAFMPCAADGTYPTLSLLYRLSVVIGGFSMNSAEIAWLSMHAANFAGVDPAGPKSVPFSLAGLPDAAASDPPALFNQWQRLNALYSLKASLPAGNVSLFDVFAAASASATAGPRVSDAVLQQIAAATGWDSTNIATLTGGFNLQDSDFRNEIRLVQIAACLTICSNLGLSALQLFDWANPAAPSGQSSPFQSIAQDVQHTVKSKYDDATWLQVGKPLNDKLRESSKDALIAYILQMPGPQANLITDANGLYGFFLIDVEMCTCMVTSRIVQASAAVQLFVQQCLLNLESDVKPSAFQPTGVQAAFQPTGVQEWNQWRKNYRVWQAAMEVFLYPENWIVPELRPNKTPFFEDLETALLQRDVTADNVEAAYLAYLESLQQVARLEIAGFYTDDDTEAGTQITHVIGRTFTTPHVYFYRTLDNKLYAWSPWEQIDADISGDSLIPVVWNRRLFLFWPLYTEVTDPTQNNTAPPNITSQPGTGSQSTTTISQAPPATKTLQIQLAWSEYKYGKWTPKQVTNDFLTPFVYATYAGTLDTSLFVYTALPGTQDDLNVIAYSIPYIDQEMLTNARQLITVVIVSLQVAQTLESGEPLATSSAAFAIVMVTLQAAIAGLVGTQLVHLTETSLCLSFLSLCLSFLQTAQLNISPAAVDITTWLQIFQGQLDVLNHLSPGNKLVLLGSFSFDGSQGSVEIDASPTVNSDQLNWFPLLAAAYGPSNGQNASAFYYQNISLANPGLKLALIDVYADSTPTSVSLLSPPEPMSKLNISFSQESLPGYLIELTAETFKKAVFVADSRRTYFIVHLLPLSSSVIKNSNLAGYSLDLWPYSFYFFNHYHPWIGEFIKRLNWKGIPYLLYPTTQALDSAAPQPGSSYSFDFSSYGLTLSVAPGLVGELVDFGFGQLSPSEFSEIQKELGLVFFNPPGDSAYSIYNWEIFFHIPLLIATRLSQNQQFEDAQAWFHYIFNPTQDPEQIGVGVQPAYDVGIPNGYWNFKPLNNVPKDGGLLALLDPGNGPASLVLKAELQAQVKAWTQAPFEPDVIAQLRFVAYQKTVVMKYLDNLIAWGDNLFGQNTRESIMEAIQIYILADQILGPRPVTIPPMGTILDQTYKELVNDKINKLGNADVELENAFPFIVSGIVSKKGATGSSVKPPKTPYFCTPANPNLLAYYDTVADRLYKIRHCMNIQGQVEQLALFAPPINPALLVAAEAAGVDLSSVLNDINAAVPHYRFTYMLSKALEICAEVRSLGAAMLSALEKYDAEGLALLRAGQEISVLQAIRQVKQWQIDEANDNLSGLQATQAVTAARQSYYNGLVQGGLSGRETGQTTALGLSEQFKQVSQFQEIAAAGLAIIPQFDIGVNGAFGSPSTHTGFGGQQISASARAVAGQFAAMAEGSSFVASMAGLMGGWERRGAEWAFQLETAALELAQIQQQINAANVRVQIATQDLTNQDLQIANASAVQDALKSKFTNQELYNWMINQVSSIFFQCYQMAYDLAKRAEVCYRFELGIQQSSYIQFGYWDSLKQGLLSGERLFQDLKRLEGAYLDQNRREYEISKSISLLLLDPFALISLKLTGVCLITLPEAYFDMDYPGHYMRRIKSVSLTIPCVTGPYTSVNCTLTLLQSKIRLTTDRPNAYPEQPVALDDRFAYDFAATESIATSTAQNDSGMFEVNFRDERYLPFEGSGVISQWQLSMPSDCNAFDFETITDVILNLRYTARDGGGGLGTAAKKAAVLPLRPAQTGALASTTPSPKQSNLQRCFSLRHEYPTEWYKFFQSAAGATGTTPTSSMQINLSTDRFPFQYRGKTIDITRAELFVVLNDSISSGLDFSLSAPNSATIVQLSAARNPNLGNARYFSTTTTPPKQVPATLGGPDCWILTLQWPDDPSQPPITDTITDIFLLCEFSPTPKP